MMILPFCLLILSLFNVCFTAQPINAKRIRTKVHSDTVQTKSSSPTDPKFPNSWYFNGTTAPSINADNCWAQGLTGKGVKVLVLDDSFDFTNPELEHKEYEEASYNYMTDSKNVAPTTPEQWHGTPVAGIIAGTHNNSVCGVGIAPGSLIAGRVVIFDDTTIEILRKGLSENLSNIDIISNSWGIATCDIDEDNGSANTYCNLVENVGIESAVKTFATSGRNGKGGVVLFAAGDTGEHKTSDTNLNPSTRIPYAITVGAIDQNLAPTNTSPTGKSLFITAPGADPGCKVGVIGPTSIFNDGTITHGCSETLTGSGASTPIVAGIIALMLEAKNTLTNDEIRQILMHTARKVDKQNDSWTTNSAGITHSTQYGFGYVDASGAVEMTRKWCDCGNYSEQITGVQTTLSNLYSKYLVNGNIELPKGQTVDIPFFMKSMGSVIIDSLSITIENISNQSVEVSLREDDRYCNTTVVSKDKNVISSSTTQQMPFSVIVNTVGDPELADDCSGKVTLTTYQYAGMSSSGEWTLRIKNNGNSKLSMPLDSFQLMARGYLSVIELSSPLISYTNGTINSITVAPYLNDPGKAVQDFGRGMRVYVWVDGGNPIPATDSKGQPLIVEVLDNENIVIPWKSTYNSLLSLLTNSQTKRLRVILVDADEEYTPFTFNTCHTVISPIVLVDVETLPPTTGGDEDEEPCLEEEEEKEEECPPDTEPEEEGCNPCIPEEEEIIEEEHIPDKPILPPDEEEAADGFNIKPIGAARIVSLLSALLIALAM